jgi:hypothetical protein
VACVPSPATDPLRLLLARTSEATATRPGEDPVIDVRVDLSTGTETYDHAQVERALQHEKPERVTVLYILSFPGDDVRPEHDPVAAARDTKSRLDV